MEYFDLLEFKKEPFSNSPEPEFLFASPQHNTCLQRIELAVRLRRGLNIVIGAVGTGKTTLCRKLIQQLSIPAAKDSPVIEPYLLLDPAVDSRFSFVKTVASILGISGINDSDQEWQIKEKIKNFLFEQGVQEQKNIVLIIDEGQKIPEDCLEILREFLNYETNSHKLLQIVIFAQPEFRKNLKARTNLLDRVNYLYDLMPLSFGQTRAMILHRLSVAGRNPDNKPLFTPGGILAVYLVTAGYPRKIVSLCHQVMLMLIIRGKSRAGWFLVRSSVQKMSGPVFRRIAWASLGILVLAIIGSSTFFYWSKTKNHDASIMNQRFLAGIDMKKMTLTPRPAPDEKETSSADIPDDLGSITIKQRMTLWRILENIYGDTGKEITRKLISANPGIRNINSTSRGDVIRVPLIYEKARPIPKGTIIVSLESGRELEPIYYSFIEKRDLEHMPAMRFLSLWNKREGRRFTIALDRRFSSAEEAGQAVRRLPPGMAASARILTGWENDTVIFNTRFL